MLEEFAFDPPDGCDDDQYAEAIFGGPAGVACHLDNDVPPEECGVLATWQTDLYAGDTPQVFKNLEELLDYHQRGVRPSPSATLVVFALRYIGPTVQSQVGPATHEVRVVNTAIEEPLLAFVFAGDDHQAIDLSVQITRGIVTGGLPVHSDGRPGAWREYLFDALRATAKRAVCRMAGPN